MVVVVVEVVKVVVVVDSPPVLRTRRRNMDEVRTARLEGSLEAGGKKMAARVAQKSEDGKENK